MPFDGFQLLQVVEHKSHTRSLMACFLIRWLCSPELKSETTSSLFADGCACIGPKASGEGRRAHARSAHNDHLSPLPRLPPLLLMQLKMASSTPTINTAAQGFLDFVNASPTPFHAVAQAVKRLEGAGFVSGRVICRYGRCQMSTGQEM